MSNGCGDAYRDRADEEAPRGEVEMLWRRMLLHMLAVIRDTMRRCRIPASVL